jgi:hypothetical protein
VVVIPEVRSRARRGITPQDNRTSDARADLVNSDKVIFGAFAPTVVETPRRSVQFWTLPTQGTITWIDCVKLRN